MIQEFNNPRAVAYANEIMQRVAGSKDVSRIPIGLRNIGGQMVLQLQSTLRNRYGLITSDLPLAWKKDPMKGLAAATGLAASSVVEVLIGP